MRLPNVLNLLIYAIGTLVGGIKKIGISGIGYGENLVTRVMTDTSSISLLIKRMMVSGTTDDIIFQKSHLWVKSKEGCVLC